MLEQVKFLTGRRAYEFHPDDLRLSTICSKPVQDAIQALFSFQSSTIGTPMATFGEVPLTIPPGIVFNTGVWVSPEKTIASIRFLHFEQRRIVIDVAGSSDALASIYEQLQLLLISVQTVDGLPLISTPESILDYSEISARFLFSLDAIISRPLRKLLSRIAKESALVPTLVSRPFSSKQQLSGTATIGDPQAFTLAPRAGTRLEDHIYFSSAPLDSEAHLSYLNELDTVLGSLKNEENKNVEGGEYMADKPKSTSGNSKDKADRRAGTHQGPYVNNGKLPRSRNDDGSWRKKRSDAEKPRDK
ncbi:MAG TPA: hypothetical protein VEL49_07785 [Ktedonobacteraceae bacterium]|nr:hypothetical protein [Ktedonobacteraceae bacterium]